ncbi:MAG: AsmA family protein [Hyphomicrobiales bacterium]
MFRKLMSWIAILGVIAIAAIIIAPFVLPSDTVKRELVNLIEDNTGWRVELNGDVAMSIYPSLALEANDIQVSPPNSDPLISAETARFALSATKLVTGTIAVEEISFDTPFINLKLDENGQPTFIANGEGDETEVTTDGSNQPQAANGLFDSLFNTLSVEKLAIDNARIEVGKQGEQPTVVKDLDLAASLADPQGPLIMKGSAAINDEVVALSGNIPSFKKFLNEGNGTIDTSLNFRDATLSSKGQVDLNATTLYSGDLKLEVLDLQKTAGSTAIAEGQAVASGKVKAADGVFSLMLDQGRIIDTLFFVDVSLNTKTPRPLLSGSIDLGAVDVQKLIPNQNVNSGTPSQTSEPSSETVGFDLSALQSIDTNITFASGSIKSDEYKIEDLSGKFILNDGSANLIINEILVVGGSASGSIFADTKASPLTTYGSIKADRLSLKTILALAGQKDQLDKMDGLLAADISFGFQGTSPDNIANTANAKGTVSLFDTTIKGLNLSEVVGDPTADVLKNLNVSVKLDEFTKPVTVSGDAVWRGERLSLDVTADPNALLKGVKAPTKVNLSSSKAKLGFNGTIATSLPASGTVTASGPSLKNLAGWLGTELPTGDGYGKFNIKTDLTVGENTISLKKLSAALDDLKGTGEASVNLAGKPDIKAAINFDLLDVNPYLATSGSSGGGSSASSSAQWSSDPIDFSALNAANIDLTANVKTLKAEGMSVGPLTLKASIKNGKLDANLANMKLYKGSGTARVKLDATGPTPALDLSLTSSNISALPFLTDAAKFSRVEGGLALDLAISAKGKSQKALISTLNGTSKFAFTDGALRGVNIARSMRSLTSGALSGWNNAETEKTDFSAFNASFVIQDGIASNSDLSIIGPLVRVTGKGSANMPAQSLKYRVNPKVVASLKGQGGNNELSGFSVPVVIDGPWSKPRIYPDISGFLENPAAGIAKLKSLGGGFAAIAGSKPAELVSKITGGEGGIAGTATKAIGGLLKNGNLSQEGGGGIAGAIGALGAALGSNGAAGAPAAALKPGDVPVPRIKPKAPAIPKNISNAVGNIIKQKVGGSAGQSGNAQVPAAPAQQAEKLIKGLGGLLKRN